MISGHSLVPVERIERRIVVIRGHNVMLDADLAKLYRVETRVLVQAVKRNIDRFPEDFMLQLSEEELTLLRSQSVISNPGRGGRRYLPHAFTVQGVAMLSSVLRSKQAILVNIEIMWAFVRLRAMAFSHKELARKVDAFEKEYDSQFKLGFDAIRKSMDTPEKPRTRIGFRAET